MSGIRKQAIISSILVYIGVFIGAVNFYFYTTQGAFSKDQYGLTYIFFSFGQNIYAFASLGIIPVVYKFFPYYKDNLPDHQNDLLGKAFITVIIGFILAIIAGWIMEPLMIRKFSEQSKLFIDYYFWVFPFGFGLLFFSLFESYAWSLHKSVYSNFLKETGLRLFTMILILLYFFHVISFNTFIKCFSFLFILIAACLLIYLLQTGKLHLSFKKSIVTKKFRKKMLAMQLLLFGGICVNTLGATIDGMVLASLKGLADTGIYAFAFYLANLIQIPQRSIQSVTTGILVREWKHKNITEIKRIYSRSCINMLILALFIFGNIWLNAEDGMQFFNIQSQFARGLSAFFIFGILRVVDAGTGVNSQVIGASNFWRFEFFTGIILIAIRIPLSYIFVKEFGIIGTAYSDLVSLGVYNYIRFEFLRRKFGMQPFTLKNLYAIILAVIAFMAAYYPFENAHGLPVIIGRSFIFSIILIGGVWLFKLTPDGQQLIDVVKAKLRK